MNIKSKIIMTLMGLVLIALSGCSPYKQPTFIDSDKARDLYQVYTDEYKKEQWDDPELREFPRVQFGWTHPSDPEQQGGGIWSIRVDGTDLRLVAPWQATNPLKAATSIQRQVRSPNGRYIAYSMNDLKGTFADGAYVLDLKTMERTYITDTAGDPVYQWSGDSSFVILQGGFSPITQFFPATGEKVDLWPKLGRKYLIDGKELMPVQVGAYLLDGGNRILICHNEGVHIHDFNTGDVLKDVPTDGYVGCVKSRAITLDGKYWLSSDRRGLNVNATPLLSGEGIKVKFPRRFAWLRSITPTIDSHSVSAGVYGVQILKPGNARYHEFRITKENEKSISRVSLYYSEGNLEIDLPAFKPLNKN